MRWLISFRNHQQTIFRVEVTVKTPMEVYRLIHKTLLTQGTELFKCCNQKKSRLRIGWKLRSLTLQDNLKEIKIHQYQDFETKAPHQISYQSVNNRLDHNQTRKKATQINTWHNLVWMRATLRRWFQILLYKWC